MHTGYSITSLNYDSTADGNMYEDNTSMPGTLADIIKNSLIISPLLISDEMNQSEEHHELED